MREDESRYYRRLEDMRDRRLKAPEIAARDRARTVKQMKSEGAINRLNASIESRGGRHEERPVSDDTNLRSEKHSLDESGSESVLRSPRSVLLRSALVRLTKNGPVHVKAVLGDLSFVDLSFINLSNADLSFVNLSNADLRYADLRYADLRSANLRYADLRYANLSYANLSYADLSYAWLRYADLIVAKLGGTKFIDAHLT